MDLLEHDKGASPQVVGNPASCHNSDGADQLVYQLVRVEEDGTVVPASEDEVIEMGSYLEEGAAVQVSEAEATQLDMTDEEAIVCEQGEDLTVSMKTNSVGSQSLDGVEAERKKILAQLAFLDALLQKLKNEEQERASLEAAEKGAGHSKATRSQSVTKQGIFTSMDLDGRWDTKSDTNIMSSDISEDFCQKQPALVLQNTNNKFKSRELESPSSTSKQNWTSTSNESLFKENSAQIGLTEDKRETSRDSDGDVFKDNSSLDNLSIRELHEAFRTTFGRQTSVKDKQWLKRRISSGLGGSFEVTSAEDGPDESPVFSFPDGTSGFVECRQVVENRSSSAALPLSLNSESLDHNKISKKRLPEATSASFLNPKFFDQSQPSPWVSHQLSNPGESEVFGKRDKLLLREEGKRKRKPTKRYIEELTATDVREMAGKAACLKEEKDEEANFTYKMHHREREKQTAATSLGISKVKFRTGYRKRCGRPNKGSNKCLTSSSSDRAAQLVRKALSLRTSRVLGSSILTESRGKIKSLPNDVLDDVSDSSLPSSSHEAEPISNLAELNSPSGDADALLNAKVRIPKKHHHPWTLREVVKLLEGVTRCGVGKWADIKKYSFSNSGNRSSTDLKDKWRNLVRASNTHYKMVAQGERHRKHSASPIPGPILVQVHELTKQCGQLLSVHGLSRSGRSVSKKYLI